MSDERITAALTGIYRMVLVVLLIVSFHSVDGKIEAVEAAVEAKGAVCQQENGDA